MAKLKKWVKNIPNALTILRIILIPILVVSFYLEGKASHYVSSGIFIFASITDYIDGVLARYWRVQSNFGRMLDPIADKMLVVSTLVMLVDRKIAPVIPIVAILCREIFVSGMREYMASKKKVMSVRFIGKLKTAVQMTAIITLLLGEDNLPFANMKIIGQVCLWIAAILTIISGYIYCRDSMRRI
jgi:cardiolipin synthase